MNVLLLTKYNETAASSRLRCYQFMDYLKKHDVFVTVSPLLNNLYLKKLYSGQNKPLLLVLHAYIKRLLILFKSKKFDMLWIHIELFPQCPGVFEWMLKCCGVPYVVDYDDAIFHDYDRSSSFFVRTFLKHKIDRVMYNAAWVVAGNSYIAKRATAAAAKQVLVLPTVIDLNRYCPPPGDDTPSKSMFVIGWIGTPNTVRYLNAIQPFLEKIQQVVPIKIKAIGVSLHDITFTSVPIECVPWSENTEVNELYTIDVGIMPLPDRFWEQGKCGYKLIQYMACSKPVIASPIGVNQEIVDHGINGFLASSDSEWVESITTLYRDPILADSMGKKGRARVESTYSLQGAAPVLLDLFRQVVSQKKA